MERLVVTFWRHGRMVVHGVTGDRLTAEGWREWLKDEGYSPQIWKENALPEEVLQRCREAIS